MPDAERRSDAPFHLTIGAGLPLLALHGGPGWDHGYLRAALDPLADRIEVTYVDLPGNGRSPRPGSTAEWEALTLDHLVAAVERVRVATGHEAVVLLGHSFGGAVAQEYALRHPDRVLGLVLVASYPVFDYVPEALERARRRATAAEWAALQAALGAPVEDDRRFEALWREVRGLYFHERDDERIARAFAGLRPSAAAFDWGMLHALPRFSVVERLPELGVPTLVVAGDDDWLGPHEPTVCRFAELLPDIEVVVLERSGHFPFLERPAEWERCLRDWLVRRIGTLEASGGRAARDAAAAGGV